ncbi:HlyD family secretion protein [Ferribacterium limneticum]|uniref:HlyD family secretion protein n=1 Tax=Ferribacterium limneticum TaxID=76259 RepID=UPI001CFA7AB4|nr:HlyD family secretion protein [Ferribacterium limneticum]UCV17810.1 HlyD family secretion protein [Ferribacterium limneticum]
MALPKKTKVFIAVTLATLAIGSTLYFNRLESSASTQSTDDAYVQADFTSVAPQISGTVDHVLVEDNQAVKAGDLLATIDDKDFQIAVDSAKAQSAGAQASIASLQAQLVRQESTIQQSQAAVAADEAGLKLAKANQVRYQNLATDGSGSVQALQQAEAQLSIQQASMVKNQAGLLASRQQIDILRADLDKATAALKQAQAAQAAAELKLSYTRITAPVDGVVGQKAVRVGAYVNAGKPLLAVVPLDAIYITANFRETQLANVRPGQAVEIKVDAFPGDALRGKVDSLGPASGVSYSAVPPHNATGNFTKIVQRLPVRISIEPNQKPATSLRVGMSVTPTIHIAE